MQRRHFIQQAAALAGWTLASTGRAQTNDDLARRKLVVVMLRGAVDGLSVVVPYGDRNYAQSRSTIALSPPSTGAGVLKLDSMFGLNPALARLKPMWDQGALAFVHASGSPDPTRSHFDAQDYMESGTPGRKSTPDGWMNRLLATLPGPTSPTRAVSMGATPPRIFSGSAAVANLGLGPKALDAKAIDNPQMQVALGKLYAADAEMAPVYRDATQSRREIQHDMGRLDSSAGDFGAPSARSFADDARRLGELIRKDPHTQLAFTSVGGWDTHVNQGGAQGQLANRLDSLGEGLVALAQGLDDSLRDTVVVVMSEFGRTVRQNGTGGTDHGRGNVMWLLGGPVNGGRMLGEWPGLDQSALVDGRDLAVVSDFRTVISPILHSHLGIDDQALAKVFPAFTAGRAVPVLRTA